MLVVYIAGPFRASNAWDIECNIRRAETLALEIWRAGAAAICPHTNTRYFQGAAPDKVWLAGTLAIMARCDAVLLTKEWMDSEGARKEFMKAQQLGIPVFVECSPEGLPVQLQLLIDTGKDKENAR